MKFSAVLTKKQAEEMVLREDGLTDYDVYVMTKSEK